MQKTGTTSAVQGMTTPHQDSIFDLHLLWVAGVVLVSHDPGHIHENPARLQRTVHLPVDIHRVLCMARCLKAIGPIKSVVLELIHMTEVSLHKE